MSTTTFKKSITNYFSVPKPPVYYGLGTVKGNRLHTRLRLGMTCLNAHQYKILRAPSPHCSCGHSSENTKHFLLQCLHYQQYRTHMIRNLTDIIQQDFSSLPKSVQLDTLLHGKGLTKDEKIKVAREVQQFLLSTGRLGHWKAPCWTLGVCSIAWLLCNYIYVDVYEYVTMKYLCNRYENDLCHYVTWNV